MKTPTKLEYRPYSGDKVANFAYDMLEKDNVSNSVDNQNKTKVEPLRNQDYSDGDT